MPIITSIFLILSLVLAVVIGPQTDAWSWGAAMLPLGIALVAALPLVWKQGRSNSDTGMLAFGLLTAGWFAWRAWTSPVAELGQADLMLLAAAVGTFVCIRSISRHAIAEQTIVWGLAMLLLASLVVQGKQLMHPGFTPVFRESPENRSLSGFFACYIDNANYLTASCMLVGAAALFGRHKLATRMLWLCLAAAGLAGVWFTHSRGGIFGAAVACGVFASLLLIHGKRTNAKWFAPAVIAIPLIGIAIASFLLLGWKNAQELRTSDGSLRQLMDNSYRLYFLGIAVSCIALHPWTGGGSRSFSWENFRFVHGKDNGDILSTKPEFVHNEFLESTSDYGLIGTGLLIGLLAALALTAVLRMMFEETPKERDNHDAWRIGALAALAGMLAQSCFSFVFHLMPGVLLLGICLGQMTRQTEKPTRPRMPGGPILLTGASLACLAILIPFGWKGLRTTQMLWSACYSKSGNASLESKIDAYSAAIECWPLHAFHLNRAMALHELAGPNDQPGFQEYAERAISDYQQAARLHPYTPAPEVNRAHLLSQLRRDTDAEAAYTRAIMLQGGMEPAYRGHFALANHYLNKGLRLFDPANPKPAHDALVLSAREIEAAVDDMHWIIADMVAPRVTIHETLGIFCETIGDRTAALASYDFASKLPEGNRAHYRASVLISKIAVDEWQQRKPSEALTHFIEARMRLDLAGGVLPADVTPAQRAEYTAFLNQRIEFLKGAKIQPLK